MAHSSALAPYSTNLAPRRDAYIMCKCKKVRLVDEEKTKLEDGDVIILYPLLSTRAAQNVP